MYATQRLSATTTTIMHYRNIYHSINKPTYESYQVLLYYSVQNMNNLISCHFVKLIKMMATLLSIKPFLFFSFLL